MTNKQAIIELRDLEDYCNSTFLKRTCKAYTQAINKGIEAIENQKSIIEELEKIKQEFEDKILLNQTVAIQIIDKYIAELKGE